MGLFSTSKTQVFSSTFPLIEADPDIVKKQILSMILTNSSLAEGILNNQLFGLDVTMGNMRKYAKEHYSLGLPTTSMSSTNIVFKTSDVEEAISDDTSAVYGVFVDFMMVVPLELHHITYPYLTTIRDLTGDIVNTPPEEWVIPIPAPKKYREIETIVRFVDAILNETGDSIVFTYEASVNYYYTYREFIGGGADSANPGEWVIVKHTELVETYTYEESIATPIDVYIGQTYCIAQYSFLDSEGLLEETRHIWYYDIETELYPKIILENNIEESNNLLPVIPIRWDNQSMVRTEVQDTELYKTSSKLLSKVHVDIDELSAQIEANDSIGDIDHAYVMFGINLQTENEASIKYLIEFFDYLADQAAVNHYNQMSSKLIKEPVLCNTWRIIGVPDKEHVLKEYGLDVDIDFGYIRNEVSIETIGVIGKATIEKNPLPKTISTASQERREGPIFLKTTICNSQLILKLQITPTLCKRIIVSGLTHRNYVTKHRAIVTNIDDLIDDTENNNFVVPLYYGLSRTLTSTDRQQVYAESFMLVLNSIVKTKLKWYQQEWFTMVMMIVIMIVICWTGQAYAIAIEEAIGAAILAETSILIAVLKVTLSYIFWGVVISAILEGVVKLLGPKFTFIIAVVTIIAAAYAGYFGKSLTILTRQITAKDLLFAANGILSAIDRRYEAMIGDVSADYEKFLVDKEKKLSLLKEAQSLLEVDNDFSLDLLNSQTKRKTHSFPGTPTEFFNLKVHAGNIGTLVLDIPNYYHDLTLTLPRPENTIMRNRTVTV